VFYLFLPQDKPDGGDEYTRDATPSAPGGPQSLLGGCGGAFTPAAAAAQCANVSCGGSGNALDVTRSFMLC